MKININFLS